MYPDMIYGGVVWGLLFGCFGTFGVVEEGAETHLEYLRKRLGKLTEGLVLGGRRPLWLDDPTQRIQNKCLTGLNSNATPTLRPAP